MTELLFQTDSYLKEFTAQVGEVYPDDHALVLDRTAFFPGGGADSKMTWDRSSGRA